MKYLIQWSSLPEKRMEGLAMFANTDIAGMDAMGESMGVKTVVRYHLSNMNGFAVVEAETQAAVTQFCLPWMSVNNISIDPVMSDEQFQSSAKNALEMMAAMAEG